MELRQRALAALQTSDPQEKVALPSVIWSQIATFSIAKETLAEPAGLPGRPTRPELIAPSQVPHRSTFTLAGRAALIHAICHIEFNAINLALDAVWRFAGMPDDFYRDWMRVAFEEAQHFTLLHEHLQTMGHRYGDFPAHDGLWEMCEKTKDDIVARMALVPRTLEARGLDATPLIQARLRKVAAPDARGRCHAPDALVACDLLDIILRDEIGHVAIGNHWYRWLCAREGLDPVAHYGVLVERHHAPHLRPPFNEAARRQAGFSQQELDYLTGT
jgi:uncharacterized ferritin-like protein (DUF455 family)